MKNRGGLRFEAVGALSATAAVAAGRTNKIAKRIRIVFPLLVRQNSGPALGLEGRRVGCRLTACSGFVGIRRDPIFRYGPGSASHDDGCRRDGRASGSDWLRH